MTRRVVLVVEDGTEYVEAFRRLAGEAADVDWLRAADAAAAQELLHARTVDAIFLDVVFDRTPPGKLVGDRARGLEHLARNQGFHVLAALAQSIPAGAPVLLAHDFASQPARLAALRQGIPGLEGVAESAGVSKILERLLATPSPQS